MFLNSHSWGSGSHLRPRVLHKGGPRTPNRGAAWPRGGARRRGAAARSGTARPCSGAGAAWNPPARLNSGHGRRDDASGARDGRPPCRPGLQGRRRCARAHDRRRRPRSLDRGKLASGARLYALTPRECVGRVFVEIVGPGTEATLSAVTTIARLTCTRPPPTTVSPRSCGVTSDRLRGRAWYIVQRLGRRVARHETRSG